VTDIEQRRKAVHDTRRVEMRGTIQATEHAAMALLMANGCQARLQIRWSGSEPVALDLHAGDRRVGSIDYSAVALTERESLLQMTGAHMQGGPAQEARLILTLSRYLVGGLTRMTGQDGRTLEAMATAMSRNIIAPLHGALLRASSYERAQLLKTARRASPKARPAAASLSGTFEQIAEDERNPAAVRRGRQAMEVVPALPLLFRPDLYRAVAECVVDG